MIKGMKTPDSDTTLDRRTFLAASTAAATTVACGRDVASGVRTAPAAPSAKPNAAVAAATPRNVEPPTLKVETLSFPWATEDPFLFCAYHLDNYPVGAANMGPSESLAGRRLGSDFSRRDGWSMYHGQVVPGFPRHPHRGFETVTVTRKGYVDHSDSLGATARYGMGDAQWMTAGKGIVHAEMFPLRSQDQPNPMELFQVWLNLPAKNKMVPPHFTMLWHEHIPRHEFVDAAGRKTVVTTIAGALEGRTPPSPPPQSWASNEGANVSIWTIDMDAGAQWTLPAAVPGLSRTLYFFRGDKLVVSGQTVSANQRIRALESDRAVTLQAGEQPAEILLLEGRPLGEPVAHHGPFVMNTRQELQQAFSDYRKDGFGGWKWPSDAPVHAREQGRFAIHVDGKRDVPG